MERFYKLNVKCKFMNSFSRRKLKIFLQPCPSETITMKQLEIQSCVFLWEKYMKMENTTCFRRFHIAYYNLWEHNKVKLSFIFWNTMHGCQQVFSFKRRKNLPGLKFFLKNIFVNATFFVVLTASLFDFILEISTFFLSS